MSKLSEYGFRVTVHGDDDVITAILRDKNGEQVGEIEALFNDAIEAYQVKSAYTIDSVPKGKGIGQEFYSFLNAHIKRKGSRLASDFKKMQSEPAQKLWSKFKSTGKASGPYQYKPRPTPEMTYDMMETTENQIVGYHATRKKSEKPTSIIWGTTSDYGPGLYFALNPDDTKIHGELLYKANLNLKKPLIIGSPEEEQVSLKLKKALKITDEDIQFDDGNNLWVTLMSFVVTLVDVGMASWKSIGNWLIKLGYDSIIVPKEIIAQNKGKSADDYVVVLDSAAIQTWNLESQYEKPVHESIVNVKPNYDLEEIQERESFFKPIAEKINLIAKSLVDEGNSFGKKVYISDVLKKLGVTREKFGGTLILFNQLGWIELQRADLRGGLDQEKLSASEISYNGSTYDFIISVNSKDPWEKNETKARALRLSEWRRRFNIRWHS